MSGGPNKNLIPLVDAQKVCPISEELFHPHAKQGDLKKEFISLQEAATLCSYTQEYLSLRARQRKLRAVKIGRNWRTTKKWLGDYVAKAEAYKKSLESKQAAVSARERKEFANKAAWLDPPANLPVHAPEADAWEMPTLAELAKRSLFWRNLQFAGATLLVVGLLLYGVAREQDAVFAVADKAYPVALAQSSDMLADAGYVGFALGEALSAQSGVVGDAYYAAGIGEIFGEYLQWLSGGAQRFAAWFGVGSTQNDTIVVEPSPAQEKTGLVVLPSASNNELLRAQVQQSFSDEVRVTPHNEEFGIITPVFREREGEDYLYILVPLQENPNF